MIEEETMQRYVEQMTRLGDWIERVATPAVKDFLIKAGMLQRWRRREALRRARLSTQIRRKRT